MPIVASINYVTRRIYLSADTVGVNLDTLEVYREVRERRRINEADRKFLPIITAGGNIPKIPGQTYTPIYVILLYGCRIVPYDVAQSLKLVRDTFTDDGVAGRDVFDRSGLTSSIDIDVDFPAVEVREVNVSGGGGGTAPTVAQIWALPKSSAVPGTIAEAVVIAAEQATVAAISSQG
jgi:hypothetical protein